MSSKVNDPSLTPAALQELSDEQTERLTAVLDEYLARLEAGDQPNLQELLTRHADIAEPLKLYIGKLGELHNFAAGFSPHLGGADEEDQQSSDTFEAGVPPKPLIGEAVGGSGPDDTDATTDGSTVAPNQSAAKVESPVNDPAQRVPTRVLTGDIDPDASQTIRKLGDFELLRVIGRGGMGIVYEALQLSLKRRVALKLLPLISVLDARQIARFKNEAQAAANLQHPNIVPVHAVGNYQGVHYYAMRFIDGHPLDAIIAALKAKKQQAAAEANSREHHDQAQALGQEHIDWSAAEGWTVPPAYQPIVRIGIQAASALASAHIDGIIHRDIKPSNLMLDKKGKTWITDFGLARRITDHSLTATGDITGTLRYMSPEQAKAQSALVDGRTDVYSLGATLYELLALEPAITGDNSPAMLRAIDQQLPIPLRQHRPDLPRDLVTVIEKAMSKNRDERYLTAQDFADDLTRVLEGRPTLAKPPTWLERGIKWIQRNQRLVKVAAAIMLTATLFFGAGLAVLIQNRSERQAAEREARQRIADFRSQSNAYFKMFADLEGIPGTDSVRQQAYKQLLDDYRSFVSEVRTDIRAPDALDLALLHMGDLQREMQDWSGAAKSLTEAEQLLRQHVIGEPKRIEHRHNLANCLWMLGIVKQRQGDMASAERLCLEAASMLEQLVAKDPDNSQLHCDWAKANNALALLWMDTGSEPLAAERLFRTKARLEQNIAQWPEETTLKQMLFAVCNNLAGVVAQADARQATLLYQTAIETQLQVCQIDKRVRPSADLAVAYMNLGRSLSRQQEYTAARQAYDRARSLSDLVRQLDPSNSNYARNYGLVLNNLAMAEQRTGESVAAEGHFREALRLLQPMTSEHPDSANLHHEVGGIYNNLANLLEHTEQVSEVDNCYRQAIEHQERAVQIAPAVTAYLEFLDTHLMNYSRWLTKTSRYDLALESAQQRTGLWPKNDTHQLAIARDLADQAFVLAGEKRKPTEALRYGEAAKRTLELAQNAGLSVQSYLEQDSFSSLAKLKSLTELARP